MRRTRIIIAALLMIVPACFAITDFTPDHPYQTDSGADGDGDGDSDTDGDADGDADGDLLPIVIQESCISSETLGNPRALEIYDTTGGMISVDTIVVAYNAPEPIVAVYDVALDSDHPELCQMVRQSNEINLGPGDDVHASIHGLNLVDLDNDGLSIDLVLFVSRGDTGSVEFHNFPLDGDDFPEGFAPNEGSELLNFKHGILADLDGNDFVDLVGSIAGATSSSGRLVAWLRSDASFSDPIFIETSGRPGRIVAQDFGATGGRVAQEVVVAIEEPEDHLDMYHMEGTGLMSLTTTTITDDCQHGGLAAGDLEGEGPVEVALACDGRPPMVFCTVPDPDSERPSFSNTALEIPSRLSGIIPRGVTMGDIDGSGTSEVVIRTDNQLFVLDRHEVHLPLEVVLEVEGLASIDEDVVLRVADVNGDGLGDVIEAGDHLRIYSSIRRPGTP
jgi:hypothetical protein